MQNIDPNLPLHILLEGTDCLEGLFGDCWTQDHACNFYLEQLSEKLGVATLINIVMERNPELDRGHCCLSLKDAMGIGHVNPRSWTGSVCVGDVDIRAEWKKGQTASQNILGRTQSISMNCSPKWIMIC